MNKQRGQILLITVMLIATILTVVLAVTFKSTTETQLTKLEEESQKALSAAEAGVELALQQGYIDIGALPEFSGKGIQGSAKISDLTDTKFVSPLLKKDQQYSFYLSDYPSFSQKFNGPIALYLDSESSDCPSIEMSFLGSAGQTLGESVGGCNTADTTWKNEPFTPQNGTFTAEFDVTPKSTYIDLGDIGVSDAPVTGTSSSNNLIAGVRFNNAGKIRVLIGSVFDVPPTGAYNYSANTTYHFRMVLNVTSDTYAVYVTPQGGSETLLGQGLAFKNAVSQISYKTTHLNSLNQSTYTMDVCNFIIDGGAATPTPTSTPASAPTSTPTPTATPAVDPTCSYATTSWQNNGFSPQEGSFTAEFDAKASSAVDQGDIGFSNNPVTGTNPLTVGVRFNTSYMIRVLDGPNGFIQAPDIPTGFTYENGRDYHFRFVVDVPSQTYSVYVTPAGIGQTEQRLGSGLRFKNSVSQLNNRAIQKAGGSASLYYCNFQISGGGAPATPTPTLTPPPPPPIEIISRGVIDPCGKITTDTAPGIGLDPGDPPFDLGGYSFRYKSVPISVANQAVLIVRSLFAPTRIGIESVGQSPQNLPLQGKYVVSEVTTASGVSKKIQLFQSYPQIPAEFFVTSF